MTSYTDIVDAGMLKDMIVQTADTQTNWNIYEVDLLDYSFEGDGKTIVTGFAEAVIQHGYHEMTKKFGFEINAGTTKEDIVLGDLEVIITEES